MIDSELRALSNHVLGAKGYNYYKRHRSPTDTPQRLLAVNLDLKLHELLPVSIYTMTI
jgi:hypothetical protein